MRGHADGFTLSPSVGCSLGYVHQVVCVLSKLVVDDEEDEGQRQTQAPHGDVGDAQEGVSAAQPRRVGQDDALAALERQHGIAWATGAQEKGSCAQALLTCLCVAR